MTVSERLQKTEEVINRIYQEHINHRRNNHESLENIKVSRDEYHMLLVYKERNNPISVQVTEMGTYKVRCFGILVLIQDTW